MKELTRQNNKQILQVTYLGMAVNLFLAIIKSVTGLTAGSIGLLADGIHSLSDLATDGAVLLGIRLSAKEPDDSHPFGHGRMETFSAAAVALILGLVGGGMIYRAAADIAHMHAMNRQTVIMPMSVLWIAMLSIAAKEALYQITRLVAVRCRSTAVYANAWHHRSDALSSVAVLVGAGAVRFLNYPHGDQLAAIGVGLMIILVAVRILGNCIGEFSEKAVDQETLRQIEAVIVGQPGIIHWHKLRTRSVGREIFLDVHILVDPQLNITEAHAISEKLETALHTQIPQPVNVMVHIEPNLPELRK